MPYQEVHITDLQPGSYVVQVGKRKFARVLLG